MAFTRPAGRLHWLLIGPLVLQSALPAAALEAAGKGLDRSAETLLAQAPAAAEPSLPAEVQSWADGAAAAYKKRDTGTALRLQKLVVAWLEANRSTLDGFRALAMLRLGVLLRAEGQRHETLAPTEEAVKIYRELAKTNRAYLGDLANSLNNLGNCYSNLGRRQESLTATEESVKISRELAKTNPAVLPDLANSLNNLGTFLSELGRRQEALTATEESVKIRRELAKTNPAFLNDLAASLNNLGNRFSELGRRQEALAPTEEAVKTYRELGACCA